MADPTTAQFRLGRLCKRGHDYNGTGQSLRYESTGNCVRCLEERAEQRRSLPREREPAQEWALTATIKLTAAQEQALQYAVKRRRMTKRDVMDRVFWQYLSAFGLNYPLLEQRKPVAAQKPKLRRATGEPSGRWPQGGIAGVMNKFRYTPEQAAALKAAQERLHMTFPQLFEAAASATFDQLYGRPWPARWRAHGNFGRPRKVS